MPRKAPTSVIEQRITFGNYERQFVTEIKNDIETGAKVAVVSAAVIPVCAVLGGAALGYGAYAGMCAIAGANPLRILPNTAWLMATFTKDGTSDDLRTDKGSYLGALLRQLGI